jgi:hypothetical protein
MFSVDPSFAYIAYLELGVFGLIVGLFSGALVSIILKLRVRGTTIIIDGFLGATGAVITANLLWRFGFQYNFVAAFIIAVSLPALHQIRRSSRLSAGVR